MDGFTSDFLLSYYFNNIVSSSYETVLCDIIQAILGKIIQVWFSDWGNKILYLKDTVFFTLLKNPVTGYIYIGSPILKKILLMAKQSLSRRCERWHESDVCPRCFLGHRRKTREQFFDSVLSHLTLYINSEKIARYDETIWQSFIVNT